MLRFVKKKIKRLIFVFIFKPVIYLVWRFDTKPYMFLYIKYLRASGVHIGRPFYIDFTAWLDPTDFTLITIKDDAVLARGATILAHDYSIRQGLLSAGHKLKYDYRVDRPVYIGENVFVGINSIIKPGTYLESNCIVASGSVVQGKFNSYSIIAGNPAQVIGDVREWIEKKKKSLPEILASIE